ncbi:MAG: MFS transporter [Rhodocyclales bacterium]|nr:MFS transporter [Rhodocyclales bacterium]
MTLRLTPEQKRRRTLALCVILAAYVLSFFQRFAPVGIAQDLARAFQTSAAALGGLAATYFYVYTLMQVPAGILSDTLGPRRILLLGGLIGGGGSLLFGLAGSLEAALLGRALVGLGVSVTFIAMLKIIAVWFEENRFASLVGLSMLVGNLGAVLAGAPLSALTQSAGWRGVFIGVGALSLLLAALCWWLVRDRPQAAADAAAAVPASATARGAFLARPPCSAVVLSAPTFDRTVILGGLLRVVRNPATWPTVFVNAGISGSFFAFAGLWATPFLVQGLGMSRATAAAHLSLYFACFAAGCLLIGMLSDRLQRRKPVILIGTHIYSAIWLIWLSGCALPPAATWVLFGLMGLTTASFTLTWACAKEVNPPLLSGMSTSVANMGGFLAGALLQPAVGLLLDARWNGVLADGMRLYTAADYRFALLLPAISSGLGAAAAWRLRETGCRNIWREEK